MLITLNHLKSSLQAVKTYINNVLPKKVSDLVDDSGHYTKPSGGIPASDLADGVVPVEDVHVNGVSVLNGGVADIPIAKNNDDIAGVVKLYSAYGVQKSSNNYLQVNGASQSDIKTGANAYKPIVPLRIQDSTFYGLAKAAGDTTQSSSDNAVGTYTTEAKSAIRSMLGIENAATIIIEVQGTSPTITAQSNIRYVCGEVTSITITPPQIGICDVIFTSGSTPAILTLPNTVKMPDWIDLTILEANTIYEINIVDGIYGMVMTWTI